MAMNGGIIHFDFITKAVGKAHISSKLKLTINCTIIYTNANSTLIYLIFSASNYHVKWFSYSN